MIFLLTKTLFKMKKLFTCFFLPCFMLMGGITAKAQITILSQNFESGSIPSGWTQTTSATDGGWKVGNNTALGSQYYSMPSHTKFVATNDDKCNCNKSNDLLKTASFDLSSYTTVLMSFDYYYFAQTYQGSTEEAKVVVSIDGGTSWTDVLTLPSITANEWQRLYIDLSAYAGNSNVMLGFKYNDGGGWLYGCSIDNLLVYSPAANDARLSGVTPITGSTDSYAVANSNLTIGGTIFNEGANPITSFTVKYSDGANTYSDTKTGVNIAAISSYTFTHNTPYAPSMGKHPLKVWVELTNDANQGNDTLSTTVAGVSFLPSHRVVFEEATGTWCGWCIRGLVYMDSIANVHPDNAITIAVHNGDPMTNSAYDSGLNPLLNGGGYPSVVIDRTEVDDPSTMFDKYDAHIGNFGYANLSVNTNVAFVGTNRTATVKVNAHFAASLNGNYKLAVVFTEDKVTGTASGYAQHNYYSGGSSGPMGGFENLPDPVPASQMVYNHVARAIVGAFSGSPGSLPSTIIADSNYSYTFTYNIPSSMSLSNIKVIALLLDGSTNAILNGNEGENITLGLNEVNLSNIAAVEIYPNPVNTSKMNLHLDIIKSEDVTIAVTNILGQVMLNQRIGSLNIGNHTIQVDANALTPGVYFLNIKTPEGTLSRKFVKE